MKRIFITLMGTFLILAGCQETLQKEDALPSEENNVLIKAVENLSDYQFEAQERLATLKSKGKLKTKTFVFHNSSGTMGVVPNPDACGDFSPPLQFVIEGEGNATHLGLFTVENLACVDMLGNFLSPVLGFITAANGHQIHTMLVGVEPDPDNPPYTTYYYIVLGGTGKFINASGFINMYGITDEGTGTWNLTGEGEITY